jgi:hypothetical protein
MDIGEDTREVELEPFPASVPVTEPTVAPAEPEQVPA